MTPTTPTIILAGATGHLGGLIAEELRKRGAHVRALVRVGTEAGKRSALQALGAEVVEVDFQNAQALTQACQGGTCVVSALSGLRDVIVDTQTQLLKAAVAAGVPRFIPSDFSIDFTKLTPGHNRNLDFRLEFKAILDKAPIQATSILNGMFTDLLTGQAPMVLFPIKRVMYYGNANQLLDFTTIANTAAYTAAAALDPTTPRYLRIAGDVLSVHGLVQAASAATGEKFKPLRVGGLGVLNALITVTKMLAPGKGEVFPAWQGMQYMRDMFAGKVKLEPLDNARYPEIKWTTVQQVLAARKG
ncbi:NmrA family protein [Rufibacter radiotolerans]|uniref:NmrA family protein n=1 Tax=Rufibacter radiotolerans TaxID=1379910 RepID=A0A0H4VS49_9BACT|nr:NmrA family NAD(P)-binding protein [Rufibacter radiotolerans]AKQ46594.1 NmrA family protein [Rufibacter radiotolerans]